ncbi:MAG: hypothetical protein LUH55_03320 [Bacteroides thetaiotaomicron]|nr:hypothetical protein [Bacteroides thetaiotaomicron]
MINRGVLYLDINKIFIYIIIILNLNIFYLVDSSSIPLDDICLLIEVIFFLKVVCLERTKVNYRYNWLILFALVIIFVSSIAAYYSYGGQPLFYGIRAQRHWLMALLMYFPISKLLKLGLLSKSDLTDLVDNICIILGILVFAQTILGTGTVILNARIISRYGNIRIFVNTSFFAISFFHHFSRVLTGERIKIKDIIMIIIPVFVIVFVSQSRMSIITMAATVLIMLLANRLSVRKLAITILLIACVCVYLGTDSGMGLLDTIVGMTTESDISVESSEIRDIGRAYFIEENTSSVFKFVFGSGYANKDWPAAYLKVGYDDGIYPSDNGIFGLFYFYGFIFVIWTAVLNFKLIRDGIRYKNSDLSYYLVCGLLGVYTLYPYSYATNISFALICAIIDQGSEYCDSLEDSLEEGCFEKY